jgi:hypothetical protein
LAGKKDQEDQEADQKGLGKGREKGGTVAALRQSIGFFKFLPKHQSKAGQNHEQKR